MRDVFTLGKVVAAVLSMFLLSVRREVPCKNFASFIYVNHEKDETHVGVVNHRTSETQDAVVNQRKNETH